MSLVSAWDIKTINQLVHYALVLRSDHCSSFLYLFSSINPTGLFVKTKFSKYAPLFLAVLSAEASLIPSAEWKAIAGGVSTGAVSLANKFIGKKAATIVAAQQGAKVQYDSKYATMTEVQVQEFMDEPLSSKNKKTGLSVYFDAINWSPMIGFSFKE